MLKAKMVYLTSLIQINDLWDWNIYRHAVLIKEQTKQQGSEKGGIFFLMEKIATCNSVKESLINDSKTSKQWVFLHITIRNVYLMTESGWKHVLERYNPQISSDNYIILLCFSACKTNNRKKNTN